MGGGKVQAGGDKLRKDQGELKGHPNGMQPGTLLASLLKRATEEVEKAGEGNAEGYIRAKLVHLEETDKESALKALGGVFAERAKAPMAVRATRCFRIETKDGEGKEVTKWIAAATKDRELTEAFEVAMRLRLLCGIGVSVVEDHAPQSGAAKKVQKLVFGGGRDGASGSEGNRTKKGRQS